MEILDGPVISEMIFRRYARNPHGWSYTVSPSSSHGFYDAVIASPEESWHLKLDTIFKPSPLVIGSRSAVDLQHYAVSTPLSFGYREMNPAMVRGLGDEGEGAPGLAELLASLAPVVPESGRAYAHGPFVLTRRTLPIHDQAQAQVDERLTSDMLTLVRNRYPSYG
ncbi:MAG: hypothetical protein ABSG45_05105 [Nitrososphaerales archaeon]|jgi:hypothetical protein